MKFMSTTLVLVIFALFATDSAVTTRAQSQGETDSDCICRYPMSHRSFEVVKSEEGANIQFTDELQELSRYHGQVSNAAITEALDEVLAPIGVVSFSTIGQNLKPLQLDWSIPFDTSLGCAQRIVDACGLRSIRTAPDALLVGDPEYVEAMPFVYFTFPLRMEDKDHPTGVGLPAAEIVKWLPQARSWHLIKDRWAAVGVGYAPLGDGTSDWIAVVWNGEYQALRGPSGRIVRFRIGHRFGRPWPECIWSASLVGTPVLEFKEDVDLDGQRDILIKGDSYEVSDRILSGASGEVLATFSASRIVVSDLRPAEGPGLLMSVDYVPDVGTNRDAPILKYDCHEGEVKVVNETSEGASETVGNGWTELTVPNMRSKVERVIAQFEKWGGQRTGSRVYVLPGYTSPDALPRDMELVKPVDYNSKLIADKTGYEPKWLDRLATERGWIDIVIMYEPSSSAP